MDFVQFLRGIIAGFLAAVPIGPVNVLCIQRTLNRGRVVGLVSGLGAATVDLFYGGVAGLGSSMVSEALAKHDELFRLVGGLFVIFLGVTTILNTPRTLPKDEQEADLPRAYFSTLGLALANPATIFSYGLLFAALGGMHSLHGFEYNVLLAPGVFFGSTLWWIILTSTMGSLRHKMNENLLKWLNRLAGGLLTCLGLFILLMPL